jgi:hypothetical protein
MFTRINSRPHERSPTKTEHFFCFHTSRIEQENPRTSGFEEEVDLSKKEKRPEDAFASNAETRNMIEQAVLAVYEKVVGSTDQMTSEKR